jgi:hypothetical protein
MARAVTLKRAEASDSRRRPPAAPRRREAAGEASQRAGQASRAAEPHTSIDPAFPVSSVVLSSC